MIRNNICINAHPEGCAAETERQIAFVTKKAGGTAGKNAGGPKAALILGCSTGYGLASRIVAGFGYGAATVGVSLEKPGVETPTGTKSGTPGWYNNAAFDRAAEKAGLTSVTLNADAFADATRDAVIAEAKTRGIAFDAVVYSIASPVRSDPATGVLYRSALKPIGAPYSGATVDMFTGKITTVTAEPASDAEIADTVKVMGGEDWALWIDALSAGGVLAKGAVTVAYSYIGPELSHAIYRDGTIGGAKKHLEATAHSLDKKLGAIGGHAFVSINKGLVTRSSAVIPIIPLYLSILFRVMKDRGTHEGCIEQMDRLFRERLYTGGAVPIDENGLIRIDDYEMDAEVQAEVNRRLAIATEANINELADLAGYRADFLAANGFTE
jgi:enoyl-[acyl-carrier protein] reductase/trans-2-enoyl-CoA reductase (NAD+)